jgi:hypothetical protein
MSSDRHYKIADAQILGYIGIFCVHSKSAPCSDCAKVLPDQLRPDKRAEFDRIKQAVTENPYWPEIPPGLIAESDRWSGYGITRG